METNSQRPQGKQEKKVTEKIIPEDITSEQVANAHASGDGSIKRSEEAIETPPNTNPNDVTQTPGTY